MRRPYALIIAMLALAASGCTGIGYLVGHGADHSRIAMPTDVALLDGLRDAEADLIERGVQERSVTIQGRIREPYATYAERYEVAREKASYLPALQSLLTARMEAGRPREGRFAGFEGAGILLGDSLVPLHAVLSLIDSSGAALHRATMRADLEGNRLPSRSLIVVLDQAGRLDTIRADRIDRLVVERGTHNRKALSAVGAVVDAAVVAVTAAVALSAFRGSDW